MQISTLSRAKPEKVYIVVHNNEGDEIDPGQICEWDDDQTDDDKVGYYVELVDAALNTVSGIAGHKVAGVVDTTISTGEVGRLQIYGAAQVRAVATLDKGLMVGAANAAVSTIVGAAGNGAAVMGAVVGWTIEGSPNNTNAIVMLSCL